MSEKKISLGKAAHILRLSPAAVFQLARSGKLPGEHRDGQWWFRPEDVQRYHQWRQPEDEASEASRSKAQLSLEEAARFLELPTRRLIQLAESGQLPGQNQWGRWSFRLVDLESFLQATQTGRPWKQAKRFAQNLSQSAEEALEEWEPPARSPGPQGLHHARVLGQQVRADRVSQKVSGAVHGVGPPTKESLELDLSILDQIELPDPQELRQAQDEDAEPAD